MNKTAIILALCGVVSLAACRSQPPLPKADAKAVAPPAFKMELTTFPDPPPPDKTVVFRLKVADLTGHPVAGAQAKAALVMVTMEMGKNELIFADQGDGNYEGTGKFTMTGPWNVVVTATLDGKTGRQTFSIPVKP